MFFVISRRVVLQLFIMQHVLCADIRAAKLAPRFFSSFRKNTHIWSLILVLSLVGDLFFFLFFLFGIEITT